MNLLVYEEPKIDDGKEQKSKDIVTLFIHFHDTIQYHLSKYCPSQNWILILVHWGISCAAVVPKNGLDLDYCWIIVPLNMKGGISEIPQHFYFKKKKKWIKEWEKLCFYLLIAREGMNRKDLLYLSWIHLNDIKIMAWRIHVQPHFLKVHRAQEASSSCVINSSALLLKGS